MCKENTLTNIACVMKSMAVYSAFPASERYATLFQNPIEGFAPGRDA